MVAVRADAEIGLEDLLGAIQGVWQMPAWRERACVLWDVRQARVDRIRSPELRRLLGFERASRPDVGRARMAFVVSTDVGFGIARMVEGMVATEPIDVRVFRDDEEPAWDWLASEEEPVSG